jgi:hypothetical protein
MWGGGFWGTPREEEWRRKKERDQAREEQIRYQEQRHCISLQQRHEEKIKSKDNVLDLTRRILSVARAEEERKRVNTAVDEDDDRKPSVAAKRPRVAIKEENPVPDFASSNAEMNNPVEDSSKPKILDSIRENLLGLSYAMFDSLFATNSFQAKPFCTFLLKSGERSLAEQIAVAAVEKSFGDETSVRFILQELVPNSQEPEELVKWLTQILERRDTEEVGKKVLLEWQVQHGNTEAAFKAALQIKDEMERVKQALPLLEDRVERGQQLKQACKRVCGEDIIGVFSDTDWPVFLASVEIPKSRSLHSSFYSAPKLSVYIDYAAKKMNRTDGMNVAIQVLERNLRNKFDVQEAGLSGASLPGPSAVKTIGCVCENLEMARQKALDLASQSLSDIQTELCMVSEVQNGLETLGIDILDVLVNVVKSKLGCLPQENECKIRHRDGVIAYKCPKCRDAMYAVVLYLGLVLSIRQHDLTKGDHRFLAIGYEGNILTSFRKGYNIHPDAVSALMGDNKPEDFARCKNIRPDNAAS